MQTAVTTQLYLKQLSKTDLVFVGAALRSLQAAGVSLQGLMSPDARFTCDCLASMHVRVMADGDFGSHCTAPGYAFDVRAGEPWLWSGQKAVAEALRVWTGYGLAKALPDGSLQAAAQAADLYKERLIAFRVLDVRSKTKSAAGMLKNARQHVLAAQGLPRDVLTDTRGEDEAILARVGPRADLTEEAVREALEGYLAESGLIPADRRDTDGGAGPAGGTPS